MPNIPPSKIFAKHPHKLHTHERDYFYPHPSTHEHESRNRDTTFYVRLKNAGPQNGLLSICNRQVLYMLSICTIPLHFPFPYYASYEGDYSFFGLSVFPFSAVCNFLVDDVGMKNALSASLRSSSITLCCKVSYLSM